MFPECPTSSFSLSLSFWYYKYLQSTVKVLLWRSRASKNGQVSRGRPFSLKGQNSTWNSITLEQVSCFLKNCIFSFLLSSWCLHDQMWRCCLFLGFTLGSWAFVIKHLELDLKLFSHWGLITQSAALKILTQNSLWDRDGWEVEKLIQHSGPEGAKQSKS